MQSPQTLTGFIMNKQTIINGSPHRVGGESRNYTFDRKNRRRKQFKEQWPHFSEIFSSSTPEVNYMYSNHVGCLISLSPEFSDLHIVDLNGIYPPYGETNLSFLLQTKGCLEWAEGHFHLFSLCFWSPCYQLWYSLTTTSHNNSKLPENKSEPKMLSLRENKRKRQ